MLDSGNLIPGLAAMSMEFAYKIGVRWEPYRLEVGTAAQGGNLEVVGRIPTLEMAVSPKLVVTLTDTLVIRDLSHLLNLSLRFLKECRAQLDYTTAEPQLWIKGEQIPIVTQLETRETTVRPEQEKTEPVELEERPDLEEESAQMEPTEWREGTDLPGVDLNPPDKISVFNSLHQQYTNSLNLLNESFSPDPIFPSINPPEWERMADKQGIIGAQLGGQK